MKWLALLGSVAYDASLRLNTWLNLLRRWLGLGYWSLSGFLKEPGQGRGQIHRPLRALASPSRRGGAARAAWSAATCTSRRCGRSRASTTSTMATGWRAARRWSSIGTAASSWSTGRGSAASILDAAPAGGAARRGGRRPPPDAHPPGERRLGAAGQWRRAHPATGARGVRGARTRRRGGLARAVPDRAVSDLSGDPPGAPAGPSDRRADRGVCAPMRSTSRPRARSASPRGGNA